MIKVIFLLKEKMFNIIVKKNGNTLWLKKKNAICVKKLIVHNFEKKIALLLINTKTHNN